MSNLNPIQAKRRRNEILTGTHLVIIHGMELLKDATGNIQKIDGFPAVVVTFVNHEQKYADKMYIMDGGIKQKYFDDMIKDTGVKIPEGGKVKKSEVLKKRLYVCVQEVHHVNDDKVVYDSENKPVIEYRIFKTLPFIEGREKSLMKGDPEINGIASDQFVSYKNVAREGVMEIEKLSAEEMIKKFPQITKEEKQKIQSSTYQSKQAIKLDDIKLETPTFEEPSFEDSKESDEFDYNQIPDFPHE